MKKSTKIWLIAAASLVIVGLVMFVTVMSKYQWDFTKLNTKKYETNTYVISEEFSSISMNTDTADIVFELSDDGKCKVECYEEEKTKHSVSVQNDTLVINVIDNKPWYDYIGINFSSPKITIYLPKAEYTSLSVNESTGAIEVPKDFKFEDVDITLSTGDVDFSASASNVIKIKTSTGNIHVENISAGLLDLTASTGKVTASDVTCMGDVAVSVSTGKTYLTDITCKNVISSGSTGNISFKNVIAEEKFSVTRSTGDVSFDGSDATEIFIETDTGDITGTLLTDKVFITQTDTGSVDVPNTAAGGRCKINSDTGDIEIKID